jgi:membrane protease YdiL (CAAX protease family)
MPRTRVILEILLLFVLPVVWFVIGLGQWEQRLVVFEIFIGLVIILAVSRQMSFRDMGFRLDNFFSSAKLLLPGTILGVLIIIILFNLRFSDWYFREWYKNEFFFYYLIPGILSQEFAYRGFLLTRLKKIATQPIFIIIGNAALFALLHALHQSWFVAAGAFVMGAYLAWVYLKQPNILAASLAHGLIGSAAIILGFV